MPRPDLREELHILPGPVPATVADAVLTRADFTASREAFVLSATGALRFHYRKGAGVRCNAGAGLDAAAVASFHHGSVHGAAAWMSGYLPLHASAVVRDGRVHAFAGASGAGKSTLVAALARRGLALFADDVLTLEVAPGAAPIALPGHKRLRLWGDALALTGHIAKERVWPGLDKFYTDAVTRSDAGASSLASLTLLDSAGDALDIAPLTGAARLTAFRDHSYRPEYRLPERNASAFAQLAALAAAVPVFRFTRPRDPARFAAGVDLVVAHLTKLAT